MASRLKHLGDPRWEGIGAIAAVLALVVGWQFVGCGSKNSDNAPAADSPRDDGVSVGDVKDSDCVVVASDDVTCRTVKPVERTDFENIHIDPLVNPAWIFPVSSEELPVPPEYAHEQYHCEDWASWLAERPAYALTSSFYLYVAAGEVNQIVIQSVRVDVLDRQPWSPDTATRVQCLHQAGGEYAYEIDISTLEPGKALLQDYEDGTTLPMPPESLVVNNNYSGVLVDVTSQDGYLYSGIVTIEYVSNGEPETLRYGSEEFPFRWVGASDSEECDACEMPMYDWDKQAAAWIGEGDDVFD